MNLRVQTFRYINVKSTFSWMRQDSYFHSTSTTFVSTGTAGVAMDASRQRKISTSWENTYVFVLYNSLNGIQVSRFSTVTSTTDPTTYKTVGGGTNTLTSAPSSYSSTDFCIGANLKLEGTTDTSSLASAVTAYSDGYKATSTLALETFLGGQYGAWKGYCMVYYSS